MIEQMAMQWHSINQQLSEESPLMWSEISEDGRRQIYLRIESLINGRMCGPLEEADQTILSGSWRRPQSKLSDEDKEYLNPGPYTRAVYRRDLYDSISLHSIQPSMRLLNNINVCQYSKTNLIMAEQLFDWRPAIITSWWAACPIHPEISCEIEHLLMNSHAQLWVWGRLQHEMQLHEMFISPINTGSIRVGERMGVNITIDVNQTAIERWKRVIGEFIEMNPTAPPMRLWIHLECWKGAI